MTQAEKTYAIVFIFGITVFIIYFFIIPPTPIYYEENPRVPPPRNAIYDPEADKLITGYEYPSVILVVPAILFFYTIFMVFTNNGEKRIREIINVKKGLRDFKFSCILKIREGIDEYQEWKKR